MRFKEISTEYNVVKKTLMQCKKIIYLYNVVENIASEFIHKLNLKTVTCKTRNRDYKCPASAASLRLSIVYHGNINNKSRVGDGSIQLEYEINTDKENEWI